LDPLLSSYEEISLVITDNWLSGFVEAKGCFGISLDPGPAAAYVCSCRGLPNLGINLLISSDRSLSVPSLVPEPRALGLKAGGRCFRWF